MNYWRLAAADPSLLSGAIKKGRWNSTKERELQAVRKGDGVVLFSLDKGTQGYLGTATVTRSPYSDDAGLYHIDFKVGFVRSKALPTAPVRALLQQARLRLNYPPLFVVQLSSAEYQVMSRLIQSE